MFLGLGVDASQTYEATRTVLPDRQCTEGRPNVARTLQLVSNAASLWRMGF